jgi:hypothetical protein
MNTKESKMSTTDIHQAVTMPANTYFGYLAGGVYTLVVRDHVNTKVHRSHGAPIELMALLDLRGFKIFKYGKAN